MKIDLGWFQTKSPQHLAKVTHRLRDTKHFIGYVYRKDEASGQLTDFRIGPVTWNEDGTTAIRSHAEFQIINQTR